MTQKMWRIVDRASMAKGKKALTSRWVFVKKDDKVGGVRFKARFVAKGFGQVPSVDFTESYSPVANDPSIRTALAVSLYKEWDVECIDVEASFLNATLDEEVFMEFPKGFEGNNEGGTKVLKLDKAVYGLVQAPLAWHRDLTSKLTMEGLEKSKTDPCIFYLKANDGAIIGQIVSYVDDFVLSGKEKEIRIMKEKITKHYTITDLGRLAKHLGVDYEWKTNEVSPYISITMRDFARGLIVDFKRKYGRLPKEYATPVFPGTTLVKCGPEELIVDQEDYCSFVGKLLWLMKKHTVDCCNIV
jgi:hypothetical protein